MRFPEARLRRLLPLALALWAGCPESPGRLDPPSASTPLAVGSYPLVPRSTFTFSAGYTIAMIADHPLACAEMAALDACRPEAWLPIRDYVDPPPSVRTALVLYLAWPQHDAAPGTYPVSTSCTGNVAAHSFAAFVAHDAGGKVAVRDEAVAGTVLLWSVEPGRGAAGTYDLLLESGASVQGQFAGADCPGVARLASATVTAPSSYVPGWVNESCTCGGGSASSVCTQTGANPWTCLCSNTNGTQTNCTVPAGTPFPRCRETYFTCCPMCP
jgi:hypothetical protein